MSGDLVPERRDLRASHEDRDEVVERLRVAAGDGRLTADELDRRLETALTARTYGELELLVRDLPTAPGKPTTPAHAAKDLVRLEVRTGNIKRVGPWAVPRRLEVVSHRGNVNLDFTEAIITQPTLDLELSVNTGNVTFRVPRGVVVDVDAVTVRTGDARQRGRRDPNAPVNLLVTVSGSVRRGNISVRGPRRSFWDWLFRRRTP